MKVESLFGPEDELVLETPNGQRYDVVVMEVSEHYQTIVIRIMGAVELDDELPGADA